ncbi:hypothetical protein AM1BK_21610 [Neobacillus kokaensis]|uniref:Glyoxalase n=1 Tax=Neobacillus kokaensis TaxID=2759023 RepID=A0ABQ3N118_9BACI|nr:hypothetical protein AM1BK_21610 [Neobacillus kokaensis]
MSIFRNPQVILFSSDVVRAATFYESLGFTETFRVPNDGEPIHIDLVLDDYRIGIASVSLHAMIMASTQCLMDSALQ